MKNDDALKPAPHPTPDDYINQRARYWWQTKKALIGAQGPARERAKSIHKEAEDKLGEAVALAEQTENRKKKTS